MIRALALLLLLANLAYHLWSLQRPPPAGSTPPPAPLPPGAERLLLLSERPQLPASPARERPGAEPAGARPGAAAAAVPGTPRGQAAPGGAPTVPAEAAPATRGEAAAPAGGESDPAATATAPHCERIGPLEPEAAARVIEALRRAGGAAERVPTAPADGPGAVQLYVPAPASLAEAREIVRALGEAGLEAYVMGREEVSGAVSVGLFTEPARARDRRARVEALGYEVAERALGAPAGRVGVAVRLSAAAIERALSDLDAEAVPREAVPCGPEEPPPAGE